MFGTGLGLGLGLGTRLGLGRRSGRVGGSQVCAMSLPDASCLFKQVSMFHGWIQYFLLRFPDSTSSRSHSLAASPLLTARQNAHMPPGWGRIRSQTHACTSPFWSGPVSLRILLLPYFLQRSCRPAYLPLPLLNSARVTVYASQCLQPRPDPYAGQLFRDLR